MLRSLRLWALVAVSAGWLVACGSGDDQPAMSTNLAESQLTASTVARPDTPGPCDVDHLEVWTAQLAVGSETSDAVIRFRNGGEVRCEPDISESEHVDPRMEPDVWLDPGGWADLYVTGEAGCGEATGVRAIPLIVDGKPLVVPTDLVVSCGWTLSAFFPNELATEPCAELSVVAVEGAVVVRNESFLPCVLGELADVVGAGGAVAGEAQPVTITDLAGGDVVAFEFSGSGAADCAATLVFTAAADAVGDLPCDAVVAVGPGVPFYGTSMSPGAVDPFAGESSARETL